MPWQPDYITLQRLKDYLRIADTTDDAELALAITGASRAIDQVTNRQFGQVAAVQDRRYSAQFDKCRGRWVASIDDLQDTTGLVVKMLDSEGVATTVTKFDLQPFDNDDKGKPFELIVFRPDAEAHPVGLEGEVQMTARWGWNVIPDTIQLATLAQANRFNARREAPFGIAGSPEMGSEVRLLARADPDVKVAVRAFTRNWSAV